MSSRDKYLHPSENVVKYRHQQMKTASCGAENTAEAYLPHSERVTVEARNDSIYFYPMRQAGLFAFSGIGGAL